MPFFVIDNNWKGNVKAGKLGDVAPTILKNDGDWDTKGDDGGGVDWGLGIWGYFNAVCLYNFCLLIILNKLFIAKSGKFIKQDSSR